MTFNIPLWKQKMETTNMIEMMNIHPTGDDIKTATPVYVITKDGSDYTQDGINYIKNSLEKEFNETNDIKVITGQALNSPNVLKKLLLNNMRAYIVISTEDDVIFIPPDINQNVYANLKEAVTRKLEFTSWELLLLCLKPQ